MVNEKVDKEEIIVRLKELIQEYKKYYSDDGLSEQDTKSNLVDKFLFKVLGWDEHKLRRESPVETENTTKRTDYIYPNDVTKVIVEAKSLQVDNNLINAKYDKQVQNYAYNKAVNWAILTNFKHLKIWYVTRENQYPFCKLDLINDNLEQVADKLYIFKNERLISGSLDEYARNSGWEEKIDITSDLTFSINKFREEMNKYLEKEYKDYKIKDIEDLTQGLINRLIFIKKVEAGGHQNNLLETIYRNKKVGTYNQIKEIFAEYRKNFDTDIFGQPDEKSALEQIEIPDEIINKLLDLVSKPNENADLEYNFDAIDVDILGNMYENYLAYVQKRARLIGGKSHQKEQGVYYTPKAIVDYIVKSTVGDLLQNSSFKQVKNIKILDPACGSGSFLISAISLLDEYYKKHIKDYDFYTPSQKLKLLKNNIYGVDLDEKAVEIAKLNIYLKILKQPELTSYTELLPELKNNIKVGDSLLSNWDMLFPDTKFDVVIMNPPYVGEKRHKELFRLLRKGPLKEYYEGKMDIFYFFIHLAIKLCKENGLIGFITTDYYPTATSAVKLRNNLKSSTRIKQFIDFDEFKIFKSALGQHNMITILTKNKNYSKNAEVVIVKRKGQATNKEIISILKGEDTQTIYKKINRDDLFEGDDNQIRLLGASSGQNRGIQEILQKVLIKSNKLGDICNVNQGIISGADKVTKKHLSKYKWTYEIGAGIFVLSDDEIDKLKLSARDYHFLKPWFKNSDISKFSTKLNTHEKVIYLDASSELLADSNIKKHLEKFKADLQERREVYEGSRQWFNLWRPRKKQIFEGPKIVAPQRSRLNTFGYNEIPWYASADVYFITSKENGINLKYILGLLNSKLYYLWLYYKGKHKGAQLELYQVPLSNVPIRLAGKDDTKEMVELVDKAIKIEQKLLTYENNLLPSAEYLREELKKVEENIDKLVYKIYGLKNNEIKLIEEEYNSLKN